MRHRRPSTRLPVAAIIALLAGGLVDSTGLVLCLGSDGHRAIEREHGSGGGCPARAGAPPGASLTSMAAPTACLDLPVPGGGPMIPSAFAPESATAAPLAFVAPPLAPPPSNGMSLPTATDARAGPPHLALHRTSTVLLV